MTDSRELLADLDDEELARRAQDGSRGSFEELVRRFQVPLLRFLQRKFPGNGDGEDVLQEAFLRAFQRLDQYRSAWPFRTWIFTITYRTAVSHHRKSIAVNWPQSMSDMADSTELPFDALQRQEREQQLWQTARRVLSEDQFAAIWLHYVEEMPAGQIGQVLGKSWVSVKTILYRARKRLLPHLADVNDRPAVRAISDQFAVVKAGEV